MSALVSFVQHYGNDNLVLVVLGDHQPAKVVTGENPTHDVPISVIAHDPAVMDQIAGWGWDDGLLPSPQAPLWRMSAFRDQFLSAFGSRGDEAVARRPSWPQPADSGTSSVCAPRRAFVSR